MNDSGDSGRCEPGGKADGCLLDACRVCTSCAHSQPAGCRGTVRCPSDGITRPCRHGGTSASTDDTDKQRT